MTPTERLDKWISLLDQRMRSGDLPLVVQTFRQDLELFERLRDLVRSVEGEMRANKLGLEVQKAIFALRR